HTGSNGSTFSQRIDATGYSWSTAGENIAAGYSSVDAVMDGWIASPGHCANLMNPNFSEVGVSCVPGTSATVDSSYWTMDLAKPR
ncbi:MAG TPA: CAP domain-containing protein, partial [Burkholderiaceae bacterium]|nr:CAP domain-containing protein [Burkholderiaceae bacterium]